ncbi:hypothetical protein LG634_13145 [Streptomyces bambusae]|nr:hypothetical protein [Streptomyces bambusae]MCB5165779.1 hypothetical protein [Streptomyces bambusae]
MRIEVRGQLALALGRAQPLGRGLLGVTSPHGRTRPSVRNAASSDAALGVTIQSLAPGVRNPTNPATV